MPIRTRMYDVKIIVVCLYFFTGIFSARAGYERLIPDEHTTSTQTEAIRFIDSIKEVPPSAFWINIDPVQFLLNLKATIHQPLSIYPGNSTNFCGYGALTYLFLQDDPLGYTKLLLQLYTYGEARIGKIDFHPSEEIKLAAGRMKFKGSLDIHPAEQLWYLCLADHFKGYINFFDHHYNPGDENTFWASVNYAKFNRMVRQLLHYRVRARGSDLIRPRLGNTFDYITEKLNQGTVILYINNRILHKKKLDRIKLSIPTHFIVLQSLLRDSDTVTMTYWDYGSKTLRQIKSEFLMKIVFGVSCCTKKEANEK